jgi:hypothetical protein
MVCFNIISEKHVIRNFNGSETKKPKKRKRSKPLEYQEELPAIELVWKTLDYPYAERLHPVLKSTAQRLEQHNEMVLTSTVVDAPF